MTLRRCQQLQASGFGLQVLCFRLYASGFMLQASGFGLQASGFGLQAEPPLHSLSCVSSLMEITVSVEHDLFSCVSEAPGDDGESEHPQPRGRSSSVLFDNRKYFSYNAINSARIPIFSSLNVKHFEREYEYECSSCKIKPHTLIVNRCNAGIYF